MSTYEKSIADDALALAGLPCYLYNIRDYKDRSNGGLSQDAAGFIFIADPNAPGATKVPEVFIETASWPVVYIEVGREPFRRSKVLRAIPVRKPDGWEDMEGPLWGGCFVYSDHEMFPSTQPIKLYDKWVNKCKAPYLVEHGVYLHDK